MPTLDQLDSEYRSLRRKVNLVVQRRFLDVLKEIVADGRLNLSVVNEFEAINKMWTLLDLEWIDEADEDNRT